MKNLADSSQPLVSSLMQNGYLSALGFVGLTCAIALVIDANALSVADSIFLPAVFIVALRWGLGPGLFTSALSLGAYILFVFTDTNPVTTGIIVHFGEMGILFGMITLLVWQTQERGADVRDRARIKAELLRISHEVAATKGLEELATQTVRSLAEVLDSEAVICMPRKDRLLPVASSSGDMSLSEPDMEQADRVWRTGKEITVKEERKGNGEGDLTFFYPLLSAGRTIGVLGLRPKETNWLSDPKRHNFVETLTATIAAAIEREMLAKGAAEADLARRNEEFYAALLSSISHDFRTPLASIIGASETLALPGAVFSEETRRDILSMIREEAERLNRFVGNLLDMTKLEAGRLNLNMESIEIGDIIGTAINRTEHLLADCRVVIDIDSQMPMVRADFVLIEHVMANLLENAVKYSPNETSIKVEATWRDEEGVISVIDTGRGIPPEELDSVFEKFYRVKQADVRSAGTGLGLSICKGIVEAHGGTIAAFSPVADGKGTRITFTLPVVGMARSIPEEDLYLMP